MSIAIAAQNSVVSLSSESRSRPGKVEAPPFARSTVDLPPPSDTCESMHDYWRELASQGIIHPRLADSQQILDRNHPSVIRLNELLLPLVGRLYPERDFDSDPVQFLWMEKKNMLYIPLSRPTVVVIGTRFLSESPEGICTLSGLAGGICHELSHEDRSRKHGQQHRNSPLEEGLADLAGFQRLYDSGLCPGDLAEYFRASVRSGTTHAALGMLWTMLDIHPADSLRVRTAEMVLYDFKRTHEGFDDREESEEDKQLFREILELSRNAPYVSALDDDLQARGYDSLPLSEQMTMLAERIRSTPPSEEPEHGINHKIEALKLPPAGHLSPAMSAALDDLHESIFEYLSRNTSSSRTSDPHSAAEQLLMTLYNLTFISRGHPATIFSRFRPMEEKIEAFLSSRTPEEAAMRADGIVELDGSFVSSLGPDARRAVSSGALGIRIKIKHFVPWKCRSLLKAEAGRVVPWQNLYGFALEDSNCRDSIVRGRLHIGAFDHRLAGIISPSEEFHFGNKEQRCQIPLMGFDKDRIATLQIAETGEITQVWNQDHFKKEHIPDWDESFRRNPAVRHIDSRFFELAAHSHYVPVKSLDFLHIGLDDYRFNRVPEIEPSHEYQQELVDTFHSILQMPEKWPGERQEIAQAIRAVYQQQLTYKWVDAVFFIADGERTAAESPLFRFMMEEPYGIFSVDWKINILAMNSCAGRTILMSRRREEEGFFSEGALFHRPLRAELHKLVPEVPEEGPRDWPELLKLMELLSKRYELSIPNWLDAPKPEVLLFTGITESLRLGNDGLMPTPGMLGTLLHSIRDGSIVHFDSDCRNTIYSLFRPALGYPVEWPADNMEALHAWKALTASRFFRGNEGHEELGRILDAIESSPNAVARFEELTYLFHNCMPPDGEFQKRSIAICSHAALEILGGEDSGNAAYCEAFRGKCGSLISGSPAGLRALLVENLLTTIESQPATTAYAKSLLGEPDEKTLRDSALWGRLLGTTDVFAQLTLEERKDFLDFLTGEPSSERIEEFMDNPSSNGFVLKITRCILNELEKDSTIAAQPGLFERGMNIPGEIIARDRREVCAEILERAHRSYWLSPLGAKILIGMQLLIPVTATPEEEQEAFDYIVSKRFSSVENPDALRKLTLGLDCYCSNLSAGDKALLFTAILISSNPYDGENVSRPGQIAARVLPAMGPIEAKAAQAIQGHPNTSPEVAKDMAVTKYMADPPSRIEQFDTIYAHTPPAVLEQIDHVGQLLGSGSFYIALDVTLKDGRQGVLRVLRRNARERAHFGGKQLGKTLGDPRLNEEFGKDGTRQCRDVLRQAEQMWSEEVNPELIDPAQVAMEKFCDSYRIYCGKQEITFLPRRILQAEGHGPVSDAECSLSTKLEGPHYIEMGESRQKSEVAMAVCTRVLHAILNGESFPTDLMGGNARVDGRQVGMFDPGGMYLHCNDESDLPVMKDVVRILLSGESSFASIAGELRRKYSDIDSPEGRFLSALQKAILSLYDFIDDMPPGSLSDIGRAALKMLPPERLKALEVPVYITAALKLPNRIRVVSNLK